jgi:hypothetical protein
LGEIAFDSTRDRPTQFSANDRQPGTYRFVLLIGTDKRASRQCLISQRDADLSRRIRTCGQNKLNAHLFGEERVDVGFEDQWIHNSSMADREPTLTVDKNGQRHFSQMAWINMRPTMARALARLLDQRAYVVAGKA